MKTLQRFTLILTAWLLLGTVALAENNSGVIHEGQKYVMATHSFNVFIGPQRNREGEVLAPGPLAALAEEAGKFGHQALAVQMIGGSTPMQHWEQGGEDESRNIAKVALRQGGVDVFTMSPNAIMPEPGVDLFGDLLIKTNPDARMLVQNSWAAWDGHGMTASVGGGERPSFSNEDHNLATTETITGWLDALEEPGGYLERVRTQLTGINDRAGREMAYVVPSSAAIYKLRKAIIDGQVPGLDQQSDIFRDGMGHVDTAGVNLVTYVWFAVMYRESPIGLQALVDPEDQTSAARERVMQQIAWNAVLAEPMSGVSGVAVTQD